MLAHSIDSSPAGLLRLRLFGSFALSYQGQVIPCPTSRREQWVLALLVLRHDRAVDRSWLAGTLWPDSTESQALYNLRRSLTNLRAAHNLLATHLTAPTPRTLRWDMSEVDCDVLAFDAAIKAGRQEDLERAVRLYRGPLLEGCGEPWAIEERHVREQAYLYALETLASQAYQCRDFDHALGYLHSVIGIDPLRERAQRLLMQALAEKGELAAAIATYRKLRLTLHEQLHTSPDAQTIALYEKLRSQSPSPTNTIQAMDLPAGFPALPGLQAVTNNLPVPLTLFIGRRQELQETKGLLAKTRLLTLIGAGGCGKTRLALQMAADLVEVFPDGVWWVELASLSYPARLAQMVLSALGLQEEPDRPILDTLCEFLQSRRLLLLLDNAEHLVSACADLTQTLLNRCPHLVLLVTSREALQVAGEQIYRVPSLLTPHPAHLSEAGQDLTGFVSTYDAIRLFVERAGLQQPGFALTKESTPTVISICYRLDGIPLAIELAAARVRSLSVEEIDARLEDRFHLLTAGSRTTLPRHRTLRALIDWSYDLLNPAERLLLQRLSVFAGGWTLRAAEQVCATGKVGSIEEREVLDLLTSLVDKSLVLVETSEGATRYRFLETVRQYAQDKLKWSGEEQALRSRHRDVFLALAEEAQPKIWQAEMQSWLDRLETEHDNLRAALAWCREDPDGGEAGLRLSSALWRFWQARCYLSEGRQHLQAALEQKDTPRKTLACAAALNGAGNLAMDQGDYVQARAYMEQALAINREIGNRRGEAGNLNNLGLIAVDQCDFAQARSCYEQALAINQEIDNRVWQASNLANLGIMSMHEGNTNLALCYTEQALEINREVGNRAGEASCLNTLGSLVEDQSDCAIARDYFEQALAINQEIGDRACETYNLMNLGSIAGDQGDPVLAQSFYERGLTLSREIGSRLGEACGLSELGRLALGQGQYDLAQSLLEKGLTQLNQLGNTRRIANVLDGFAELRLCRQCPEEAVRLWAAAAALRTSIGSQRLSVRQEAYNGKLAEARSLLDDPAFTQAWEQGQAMTLEQAIEYALQVSKQESTRHPAE